VLLFGFVMARCFSIVLLLGFVVAGAAVVCKVSPLAAAVARSCAAGAATPPCCEPVLASVKLGLHQGKRWHIM
jgi:hypothetical protein